MTCREIDARLDDWLDGTLTPSEAARVEAHLAACDACREGARKLRRVLSHAAALPRSITPPRDLWPQIEQRIERPNGWSRLYAWGSPMTLAAAAVVIAVFAAVLWSRAPGTVRTAVIPTESPAALRPVAASTVADPVLAQAERDYEAAANALLEALQQRSRTVTPETLVRVRENLQGIDQALADIRQALARDPHNPELGRMLVATHSKKVDVLRRVVKLSTVI